MEAVTRMILDLYPLTFFDGFSHTKKLLKYLFIRFINPRSETQNIILQKEFILSSKEQTKHSH